MDYVLFFFSCSCALTLGIAYGIIYALKNSMEKDIKNTQKDCDKISRKYKEKRDKIHKLHDDILRKYQEESNHQIENLIFLNERKLFVMG